MRKLFNVLLCLGLLVGATGCEKRKDLTSEEVRAILKENGYKYSCSSSGGDIFIIFSNGDADTGFANGTGYGKIYTDGEMYSFDEDAVIIEDGFSDETKDIKSKLTKTLDKLGILQKELFKVLDSDFNKCEIAENEKIEAIKSKEYAIGEKMVVEQDGKEMMTLTFNSATLTDERNQYDETNPAQVIYLNYTYENLNIEEDLYIGSGDFTVMGDNGTVVTPYPVSKVYVQETPKGANCTGDEAYGFNETTTKVKIKLDLYVGDENIVRNFVLDVS